MNCLLCKREIEGHGSEHHLIPVLKGGRRGPTVILHKVCHDKIHSLFTERELEVSYNTIESLLANEEVQKFVKWVSKKPNDFYDSSRKSNAKPGWR